MNSDINEYFSLYIENKLPVLSYTHLFRFILYKTIVYKQIRRYLHLSIYQLA